MAAKVAAIKAVEVAGHRHNRAMVEIGRVKRAIRLAVGVAMLRPENKPTHLESPQFQHLRAELSGIHHRTPICDTLVGPPAHPNRVAA